jgi:hypothetical protein
MSRWRSRAQLVQCADFNGLESRRWTWGGIALAIAIAVALIVAGWR